jgi:hypothetical protein
VRTKILDRSAFPSRLELCLLASLSSENTEGMHYSASQNSV